MPGCTALLYLVTGRPLTSSAKSGWKMPYMLRPTRHEYPTMASVNRFVPILESDQPPFFSSFLDFAC